MELGGARGKGGSYFICRAVKFGEAAAAACSCFWDSGGRRSIHGAAPRVQRCAATAERGGSHRRRSSLLLPAAAWLDGGGDV